MQCVKCGKEVFLLDDSNSPHHCDFLFTREKFDGILTRKRFEDDRLHPLARITKNLIMPHAIKMLTTEPIWFGQSIKK
jgi:hypothetical protein